VDRQEFVATLAAVCQKTGWRIHAYCLMRNPFHMVVETPEPNLVEGMSWLLSTYTIRLNRRNRLSGHVFAWRYKALVVDHSGNDYFRTVCDYVHLATFRASERAVQGIIFVAELGTPPGARRNSEDQAPLFAQRTSTPGTHA
jgi:REP element-mobilizing transposase RayT